jgi:CheY-like chemotaxis protein
VRGSETVLLVEVEDGERELISSVLGLRDYKVVQDTNGKDALRVSEALSRVDLLITDVVMPEMGGGELARQLRERYPNLRVLFISGYTSSTIIHHGVVNPGTAFLQKPFSPQSLATKVRELLEETPA